MVSIVLVSYVDGIDGVQTLKRWYWYRPVFISMVSMFSNLFNDGIDSESRSVDGIDGSRYRKEWYRWSCT